MVLLQKIKIDQRIDLCARDARNTDNGASDVSGLSLQLSVRFRAEQLSAQNARSVWCVGTSACVRCVLLQRSRLHRAGSGIGSARGGLCKRLEHEPNCAGADHCIWSDVAVFSCFARLRMQFPLSVRPLRLMFVLRRRRTNRRRQIRCSRQPNRVTFSFALFCVCDERASDNDDDATHRQLCRQIARKHLLRPPRINVT